MSKSAMPVSKAKTAYGLLSEIRKLILEEPKRYNQNYDLVTEGAFLGSEVMPACKTIGCVAGWCCALKVGREVDSLLVPTTARAILGVDGDAFMELYRHDAVPCQREIGFERHARLGAAHIAKFQKKYAKQLKAKKV